MLYISGFNVFNQIDSISKLSCVNTFNCNFNTNYLKEFCSVIISDSFQISTNNILFSWSYCVTYVGDTVWFFGFVDGKDNSVKNVKLPKQLSVIQASCNRHHVVCVTAEGGCWQYNLASGQWKNLAGIFCTEGSNDEVGIGNVLKVSCGETITSVLTDKGEVYNMPNKLTVTESKIVDVASGREHILMLSEWGEVFTVGEGSRGQLGHGELDREEEPRLVEALAGLKVVAVACGGWHSCVITSDGDLYSWGWNMAGQLGLVMTEPCSKVSVQAIPMVVEWPGEEDIRVIKVACGARHTLALLDDGSVWGCGWNEYGQLAMPGVKNVDSMTKLTTSINHIQDITCGPWNSCLIASEDL